MKAVAWSLVGLSAVAVAGALGSFWLLVLGLAAVYALAALSLVVLVGWSGQLNLHVAALGLGWGAYASFALTTWGVPVVWALPLAGVVTVPFAAIVAAVAVRFRGLELAVATLAIGLIFERLAFRNLGKVLARRASEGTTPFESSFVPMARPSAGPIRFDGDAAFLAFAAVIAVVVFLVAASVARGHSGRVLRAIRERELAAESLGIPVIRYRAGAFVASIAIAATAGGLFAALKLGITPDSFTIDLSFQLLAATVIGGIGSIGGAIIGGLVAAVLPELVREGPLRVFEGERLFVLFGAGMIVALWRFPAGLAGIRRRRPDQTGGIDAVPSGPLDGRAGPPRAPRRAYGSALERFEQPSVLRVHDLRRSFGGIRALDGVDLSVPGGEICALIGPNGAGKSTLFNVVGGLLVPDEGRIYLAGDDVTELAAARRAARGIGRTFQTVEVFRTLTVEENLMVAGHRLRAAGPLAEALWLPRARTDEAAARARAVEVLDALGLAAVAQRPAGELPLGSLRALELGMALVPRPRLLLLDEPSAGLDQAETEAMASLIARARDEGDLTVLLIEHDMALVADIAEHVYVMDFGRVIAQGSPDQVRRDPLVVERYLGAGLAKEVEHARG